MKPAAPLRVLLADDHQILRQGVRALLEGTTLRSGQRLAVVAEAGSGPEALALCDRLHPQVVVLDVSLPGCSGLEVARQLAPRRPRVAVVILSMHVSTEHVALAQALGVAAYVVKGSGVAELAEAIARAAAGGCGPFPVVSPLAARLTEREREVLHAIARGSSNKEISHQLGISVHTVNTHRVHLMEKLDLHDVASLTRRALELGLG